jgi:putative radical SAM enzyme (TIGR03279 family)
VSKAIISKITPGSIADEIGLKKGDIILSVNKQAINDELDFGFYTACEYIELDVISGGERKIIEIDNPECEDIGVEFKNALFGNAKSCKNKCIFCFIDQLPPGMRKTLYFKDDDSRLSFLTGNYVTLTNATGKDIDKIIKMRLEPVNISVHTTNPSLRVFMLKNPKAADLMEHLKRLCDGELHMNFQIVLVKGVNDGHELDRTISDLAGLHPYVLSISVVPMGLTRFREGLYKAEPYNKGKCKDIIKKVRAWQENLFQKIGTRLVFAADEFYLDAGEEIPPHEEYEGYWQIENGVGMVRTFRDEFYEAVKTKPENYCEATVVTGTAAYPELVSLANFAMKMYNNVKIDVVPVENDFFGHSVTVAGLVTAGDIINQLKGRRLYKKVLIPDVMLRAGEDVFLDDLRVSDVSEKLKRSVVVTRCSGQDFWNNIICED